MDGRKIGIVVLFITLLLLPGCFGKKIKGPTWTTKFTVPMVMRVKNTTYPSKSSQIELGNGVNGLGEPGLGLTGDSNSYALPQKSWQSNPFGTVTINLNAISQVDLSVFPTGSDFTLPTPLETSDFAFADSSYSNVILSNAANCNRITIKLNNATAGAGGLTFSFIEGTNTIASTVITQNDDTAVLSLSGRSFAANNQFKIQVSGTLHKTGSLAAINFTWTTFEVNSFTVQAAQVSSKVDYNLDNQPIEFTYPLPKELDQVQLSAADLRISPQMPANLTVNGNIVIEPYDSFGNPIAGKTKNVPIIIGATQTNLSIKNELNDIFTNSPGSFKLKFQNITFSGAGMVTISSASTFGMTIDAILGFGSASTKPQGLPVDSSIDSDTLETTTLVFEVANHSPVSMNITVMLFPDNDLNPDNTPPSPDPDKQITFQIMIAPNANQTSEVVIATDKIRTLIKNKTVYHQVTVVNTSTGQSVDPNSYLEIRSRAEGRVQVNK